MTSWDIEQELDDRNCFVNGLTDKPASLGAYLTVLDYKALKKAIVEIRDKFTTDQWLEAVDYWNSQSYLAPTFKLLSNEVKRLIS